MMIEEIGEATNTVSLLEHIIIQGPELIKCDNLPFIAGHTKLLNFCAIL